MGLRVCLREQLGTTDERSFGVKIGNEGLLKLINRGIKVVGPEYAQNLAYRYAGQLYSYSFSDLMHDHIWIFAVIIFGIAGIIFIFIIRDLNRTKNANRLKSAFVSNMSHEIRTPITAILGMNELIRRESTEDNILAYSENIEKAGESLLGIINDILDFSKIETGRMELECEEYSLRSMIGDLYNLIHFRTEAKGLDLEFKIDPLLPDKLYGDEIKVKQIISNLLTNAAKYTEKGKVVFEMKLEERSPETASIAVSVTDTGIGIRSEDMDRLFEPFDRLDLKKTRSIEGSWKWQERTVIWKRSHGICPSF